MYSITDWLVEVDVRMVRLCRIHFIAIVIAYHCIHCDTCTKLCYVIWCCDIHDCIVPNLITMLSWILTAVACSSIHCVAVLLY